MVQDNGYAGKILRVNLSNSEISTVSTDTYAKDFIGGRGIALKIHWDEVPPDISAQDPENRLVFMTGPIGGVPGFSGSRWMISGKSLIHDMWSFCNMGGAWGAKLKFAGYDGIIVQGKADRLSYLCIEDDKVEIRDASVYKGKGAIAVVDDLTKSLGKGFRVVAIGAAGENRVHFATLTGDQDSSGSGGLGGVMGSKNLKAIAVRGTGKISVADKEKVKALRKRVKEIKPPRGAWPALLGHERTTKNICFGCIDGCIRQDYNPEKGRAGKYFCQGTVFYEYRAQRYYEEINEVPYLANKMLDDYGMDTRAFDAIIFWLTRCWRAGILNEADTGLPLSKIGSLEFIEALTRKVAFREGFGDFLAEGVAKAAQRIGKESEECITDYLLKTGEAVNYGARQYVITGLLFAFEPRLPIQQLHEVTYLVLAWVSRKQQELSKQGDPSQSGNYMTSELVRKIAKRAWGDEECIDLSTYKKKGLAAAKIQDRQLSKECLQFCDFAYPIYHSPSTEDHLGDPTLENQIFSAVTGREMNEAQMLNLGERVFNLQRAILALEGRRGRDYDTIEEFNFTFPLKYEWANPDCLVPGKNGEPFSRKGMVIDREEFEKMKDEFYTVRGWDAATGFQTREKLEELGLSDISDRLEKAGLIV